MVARTDSGWFERRSSGGFGRRYDSTVDRLGYGWIGATTGCVLWRVWLEADLWTR